MNTISKVVFTNLILACGLIFATTSVMASENSSHPVIRKGVSAEITKEVRKLPSGHFDWKAEDVKKGGKVEFRITVRNTGDREIRNLKVSDSLPTELVSSSDLAFTIDRLGVNESKEFFITATVKDSEFGDGKAGKCVINRATLKFNDKELSDTAVVCWGNGVLGATKLPETGPVETLVMTVTGLISAISGLVVRRKAKC
jgi:uncharacterized repeat protein (TIGR01451 family)/LPXTG-motif cell wall-anchored protein